MKESVLAPLITLVLFFSLLFAYTKFFGPIPFSVSSTTTAKSDTFNVTGEGTAITKPDIALINVGISGSGATVREAQDQINLIINRVSENIKKLGVEAKDIKTTYYTINPNYDYRSGSQKIIGYQAQTSLAVKVRDLERVNNVINDATGSGANQVGGITFDVDDKTKAQAEARQKAVEEAKSKAREAARIAGFNLGKIINYSENLGGHPRPIPILSLSEESKASGTTDVEPGSSEIKATVTLSYEIN